MPALNEIGLNARRSRAAVNSLQHLVRLNNGVIVTQSDYLHSLVGRGAKPPMSRIKGQGLRTHPYETVLADGAMIDLTPGQAELLRMLLA